MAQISSTVFCGVTIPSHCMWRDKNNGTLISLGPAIPSLIPYLPEDEQVTIVTSREAADAIINSRGGA